MKFTVADLKVTLAGSSEESYVRVVAEGLAHGEVAPAGPALTGRPVIDADVDGVFEPKAVIYEAARRVADRHEKLPADWLNDGVKGRPSPRWRRSARQVILDLPGITVSVPSLQLTPGTEGPGRPHRPGPGRHPVPGPRDRRGNR